MNARRCVRCDAQITPAGQRGKRERCFRCQLDYENVSELRCSRCGDSLDQCRCDNNWAVRRGKTPDRTTLARRLYYMVDCWQDVPAGLRKQA
jgi:hypothetical protein